MNNDETRAKINALIAQLSDRVLLAVRVVEIQRAEQAPRTRLEIEGLDEEEIVEVLKFLRALE